MIRPALPLLAAVALLAGCHRLSTPAQPAFSLLDAAGDDHGDGDLRLPTSGEPGPGELDLLAIRAYPAADGLELEAEFARPVRRPDGRVISATGETQASVAALGLWTFNLDLYVDLDRVPGSGRVDTLPGRRATIAQETAWERAVCLTPRPAEARARLAALWADAARRKKAEAKESLSSAEDDALDRAADDEVARRVLFPRRVAVSGTRVRFAVPAAFLPPALAAHGAWVAVVTAATLEDKLPLGLLLGRTPPQQLFQLGIAPGAQADRLGGGRINDPEQPPIVDVLQDGPQEAALRARPPVLRGVVPAP